MTFQQKSALINVAAAATALVLAAALAGEVSDAFFVNALAVGVTAIVLGLVIRAALVRLFNTGKK